MCTKKNVRKYLQSSAKKIVNLKLWCIATLMQGEKMSGSSVINAFQFLKNVLYSHIIFLSFFSMIDRMNENQE